MRSSPRSTSYPLVGLLIAPGSSIGLIVAADLAAGRLPSFGMAVAAVAHAPLIHAYLLLGTAVVLAFLGHRLGRSFDRAQRRAVTDPLTGLYNRRHFGEKLGAELERSLGHGRPTCVLCVDLDRLKAINDGSGHRAGDDALVTVSRSLSRNVRATDVVARIGGDEFALLLPRTSAPEASALAQRILADVARQGESLSMNLTASIGIAEWDARTDIDADDLVAAADAALYRSKAAGGGRTSVSVLSPAVGAKPRALTLPRTRSAPPMRSRADSR